MKTTVTIALLLGLFGTTAGLVSINFLIENEMPQPKLVIIPMDPPEPEDLFLVPEASFPVHKLWQEI